MEANKIKTACGVCGGKGGWYFSDSHERKYIDCGYCDGYGFVEVDEETYTDPFLLRYNAYRKVITELLSDTVARVESFTTNDLGKTIEIQIVPYNRQEFTDFVKFILKLGHYSSKLHIHVLQDFYFKPETDKFAFHWKVLLKPSDLSDLDGFIDVVKLWDKKGGLHA